MKKLKKIMKKLMKSKKGMSYLIICVLALLICLPLFFPTMDISRDDGIQHICRVIGTWNNLKSSFNPLIFSDFCNGFGYSWNLFYSPLTAYIPILIRLVIPSAVLSLKVFMFLTMLLSGIFMYQLVKEISKNHIAGVIAAFVYMTGPYHLTDLYNRIAIAELASFVFLPIVFLGLYALLEKGKDRYFLITIGASGLILTHNVMALYTAIFCFLYCMCYGKKCLQKEKLQNIGIQIGLILLITSFYWIPLLQHNLATTYEVFIPGRMYQNNTLISSKLKLLDLFVTKRLGGQIFHIGFPMIIGMVFFLLYRKQMEKPLRKKLMVFIVFGMISIFMTLSFFPFERLPNILKMIQFQWRMLEFSTFFLSIVSGISIALFFQLMRKEQKLVIFVLVSIILYTFLLLWNSVHFVTIPFEETKYLTAIPVTKSTGRVHAGCATFEYLPQKAFSNRAYIETRSQDVLVIAGTANIEEVEKQSTHLTFKVNEVMENTEIELPYIFYLGYEVTLREIDSNKTTALPIEETENGFLGVTLPQTKEAILEVNYTGTSWMKFAYGLTAFGIFLLCFFLKFPLKKKVKL